MNAKMMIPGFLILCLLAAGSATAFDIGSANDFIRNIDRILNMDDADATAFEIGNLASGLLCGCVATNDCKGIMSALCFSFDDPDVIEPEGLRWAARFLSDPVAGFCSARHQGMAYDLGLSVSNEDMNASFNRRPNAYVEAARILNHNTMEYTYYFSFNFFPTEEYSSESITFIVKKGHDSINLNKPVFPSANQGFRHRIVERTSELYDEACMKFNADRPRGFGRDELCVRVAQI
jgi:hypothetical protein